MKVVIIGGGVAGLVAAVNLKTNNVNIDVTIIEHLNMLGKKILSTGNGKCNFTNHSISCDNYNHDIIKFSDTLNVDIEQFFFNLGLVSKELDNTTRVYPYTEQAKTYLDVLLKAIDKYHINVLYNTNVIDIKNKNNQYVVKTNNNEVVSDYLIISTGGKSSKVLGSDGSMFDILKKLDLKCTNLYPGLTGLKTSNPDLKVLDGLRVKALVSLYNNEELIHQEVGEIQFKKDGISGICIMNMESRIYRLNNSKDLSLKINFVKDLTKDNLKDIITARLNNNEYPLTGLLDDKLSKVLLKGIKFTDIDSIIKQIIEYNYPYTDSYGFDQSQVTIGGIDTNEVSNFFESKKYSKMYLVGEVLNIDGDCGGYNMHFASCSAITSTNDILKKVSKC